MSRVLLGLISTILVFALSGCAGLAAGAENGSTTGNDGGTGKADKMAKAERPKPKPKPDPTPKPPLEIADLVGSDGRLTVLLLGSDARKGVVGERTDAIIVATIDPNTGRVAMVSLPRDTVNVPIAPGKTYRERINSLFWDYERSTGKTKTALKRTKKALAYAFGTEIDYYALVEFGGLVSLVDRMGGVEVNLKEPLVDPGMRLTKRGLRLKAGQRHLDGKTALAFTRSRKTSSDYDRSSRQHQVLAGAGIKVRELGVAAIPALVGLVRRKVVTDVPMRAAPALLELASTAKLRNVKSVVLAPGQWARELPGTYTIAPRVLEVRKMFDRVFKPVD